MVACCAAHYMHIAYAYMPKPFFTLTINSNNCLYHNNIIIYKLDSVIDIVILMIPI